MKKQIDILQKDSIKDLAERLKQVIDYIKTNTKFINQTLIAKKINFGRTNLSAALNGDKRYLTEGLVDKFVEAFPELNKDWIMKEKGIMLNQTPTETEEKVMISDVVSYKKSEGKPYYDVDFINGFTDVVEITNTTPDYNIKYPPAESCDFWANATGYSMQGHINHGDTVAFKQVSTEWFPLGEVYGIVTTNGHRMIKRISESKDPNCYRLVSSNPDKSKYPDQDIPKKMIRHLFKIICAIKIIN